MKLGIPRRRCCDEQTVELRSAESRGRLSPHENCWRVKICKTFALGLTCRAPQLMLVS